MKELLQRSGWSERKFSFFILINHYNYVHSNDFEGYGYTKVRASYYLKLLETEGLVEKFTGRQYSWAVNQKGQNMFKEMSNYYNSRTRELLAEYKNKIKKRKGFTGIRIRLPKENKGRS